MKAHVFKFIIAVSIVLLCVSCAIPVKKAALKPVPPFVPHQAKIPDGLAAGSILISFRIDGMSFYYTHGPVIQNAAFVAGKYGIKFGLSVIAQKFDTLSDPNVYMLYESNRDFFEIIANGLTYENQDNLYDRGEFYDIKMKTAMPYEIQESHIKQMKVIFEKRSMYAASQVFIVPWGAGDENTVKIAEKYGYKMIVQNTVPDGSLMQNYDGNIIVLNSCVGVPGRANISDREIDNIDKSIQKLIDKNATRIQVVFGVNNFITQEASIAADRVINSITSIYKHPSIKFAKISEGL